MLVIKKARAAAADLLDPLGASWQSIAATTLPLTGTPIGTQPTAYTRVAFKDRKVGAVDRVQLRACHDGESVFVRLEWGDDTEDTAERDEEFSDAAALLFPVSGDGPINTMGNEHQAVNAWQWRADSAEGRSVVAHGIGTTQPIDERVHARGVHRGGRWSVVLSRSLAGSGVANGSAELRTGASTKLGVAVWEGHNRERAGFKAYTENWTDVGLAAA